MLARVWAVYEKWQCFVNAVQSDQLHTRRCWRIDRRTRAGSGLLAGHLHTVHCKYTVPVPAHDIDGMRAE